MANDTRYVARVPAKVGSGRGREGGGGAGAVVGEGRSGGCLPQVEWKFNSESNANLLQHIGVAELLQKCASKTTK